MPTIIRVLALVFLATSFYGCVRTTALDQNALNTDPDVALTMLVLIRDVHGYPCATTAEIRTGFTPGYAMYYRVVCANPPRGVTRYVVTHNRYAPPGSTRAWIVERALY